MNAQLLREALGDAKAAALASSEIGSVANVTVHVAQGYIALANEAVNAAPQGARACHVHTMSVEEYRRQQRQKGC